MRTRLMCLAALQGTVGTTLAGCLRAPESPGEVRGAEERREPVGRLRVECDEG
jgi:hypothetical protein